MGLLQIIPPAVEPISVDEAKDWLRERGDDQNGVITALTRSAREYCEVKTGRQLITATWQLVLDSFYDQRYTQYGSFSDLRYGKYNSLNNWAIRVPRSPLQAVTSITYIDPSGITQTLDPSQYQVDLVSEPARVAPAYAIPWPVTRSVMAAITVTFRAGFGDQASEVPDGIRQAMRLLIAHWYENRYAVTDFATSKVPLAVDTLLAANWTGQYV
jgi:hypothetical protein